MGVDSKVGDAYAYALLKVLYKDLNFSSFTSLVSDMLDFAALFNTCPTIEEFLANPTYSAKQKKQFLNDFFGTSLNPIIMNFLNLLCDTKRIIYISSITNLFLEILLKSTGSHIVEVQIPTVDGYKLDINKLNSVLSDWFAKNTKSTEIETINSSCFKEPLVIFTVKETPELLGGFRLNFVTDSKVIDYSIAGKIKRIATVLDY